MHSETTCLNRPNRSRENTVQHKQIDQKRGHTLCFACLQVLAVYSTLKINKRNFRKMTNFQDFQQFLPRISRPNSLVIPKNEMCAYCRCNIKGTFWKYWSKPWTLSEKMYEKQKPHAGIRNWLVVDGTSYSS